MISTPASCASFADQCGSGWVSGTPGVRIERCDFRPVDLAKIRGCDLRVVRLRYLFRIVVEGDDVGAARDQRVAGGKPRAAETEHGDGLSGEGGDGDHRSLAA